MSAANAGNFKAICPIAGLNWYKRHSVKNLLHSFLVAASKFTYICGCLEDSCYSAGVSKKMLNVNLTQCEFIKMK